MFLLVFLGRFTFINLFVQRDNQNRLGSKTVFPFIPKQFNLIVIVTWFNPKASSVVYFMLKRVRT